MRARFHRASTFFASLVYCLSLTSSPSLVHADDSSDAEFFEKQIRPILIDHCEACHSAKTGKTNGGLALDSKAGWQKGGESGTAISPGHPEESLIVHAVRYGADGPQMPPKEKGGKLSDAQIAAIVEWVRRGAPDPRTASAKSLGMTPDEVKTWWSFQPVKAPTPPIVQNETQVKNDIDRFILAELEQRDMQLSASAGKRMLLRRATFDLTGLPPTIEETNSFLSDNRPDAFNHVIDRLLQSPAYGQRWARHWLDVARYADYYDANPQTRTAICELTEAWRYRDWVVDSLNRDLPYDEFVRLQIAGDTATNPDGSDVYPEGLIATTFLSNGVWDRGDADKEKIISDMADDNIDTIGKAFLGLTLGCARCHDHKFDPVSTEDYYGLAGIFYSSHILEDLGAKGAEYVMNRVPIVAPAVLAKRKEQEGLLAETLRKIDSHDQQHRYQELTSGGTTLIPTDVLTGPQSRAIIQPEGVINIEGTAAKDSYTVKATAPSGFSIRYVRLEALTDPNLPSNGPGTMDGGNFVINRFTLLFRPAESVAPPTTVQWKAAQCDFEQAGFAVAGAIDDKPQTGWGIGPFSGRNHVAVFELADGRQIPAGAELTFIVDQLHSANHPLGKFRLAVMDSLSAIADPQAEERKQLIAVRDELKSQVAVPIPLATATTEGGMKGGLFPNIQDVPVHIRGSYNRLGTVVPRRMPRFLAGDNQPLIATGSGRRELANWVSSKDNPLTSRVIVNRVWQWHFGEGLARTPSNLGKLGEKPSHPALLDWLAAKFVEQGWSIKTLHRMIMTSAAYQQVSQVPPLIAAKDPENVWLGRYLPHRMEAEVIRDAMLATAGQLDSTSGGPAVDHFTSPRRSLYVQTARWDRSSYATLFDVANPDSSTEKRVTSTVAPQALLFLNHDFVYAQATHLKDRLFIEKPNDDTERIRHAFQLLFTRDVTDQELSIARKLVESTDATRDANWIDFCHILYCGNEFVYLD